MNTSLPVKLAEFAQVDDALDVALALVVARMGLAGEDELHRALRVLHEAHHVVEAVEDQRGALVGGEAAREADGQRVGIEQRVEGDEVLMRAALPLEEAAAGELDQLAAQIVAQGPEFLVGDEVGIGDRAPRIPAR